MYSEEAVEEHGAALEKGGVLSRELKMTVKLFLIWEKNQARRMGRSLLLVLLISKVISKTMLKMFMLQTLIRIEPLL